MKVAVSTESLSKVMDFIRDNEQVGDIEPPVHFVSARNNASGDGQISETQKNSMNGVKFRNYNSVGFVGNPAN